MVRVLVTLALSLRIAYGCSCQEGDPQYKKAHSDVVFRGTITALRDSEKPPSLSEQIGMAKRYKIAVFNVTRVWKGEVGQTFEMPAIEETSLCTGFWPPFLKVGSDLLVYANRGSDSEYYTSICGRHKPAGPAIVERRELGPGEEPRQMKQSNSK
jgi:hypothetical protein